MESSQRDGALCNNCRIIGQNDGDEICLRWLMSIESLRRWQELREISLYKGIGLEFSLEAGSVDLYLKFLSCLDFMAERSA